MAFLGANIENTSKLLNQETFREVRKLYHLATGAFKSLPYIPRQTTSDESDKKILVTFSLLIKSTNFSYRRIFHQELSLTCELNQELEPITHIFTER